MRILRPWTILLVALVTASTATAEPPLQSSFRLGFFEGGESVYHSELRREFIRQLGFMLGDSVEIVPRPEAYGNGDWKRDSCKAEATRLAAVDGIDLMVTMGPWVVEDLLEAGYSGPILAMHRVDPQAEGLLDNTGRPVAENLTIHYRPGKIADDLRALVRLKPVRHLGVLHFSDPENRQREIEPIKAAADSLGIEITAPATYDNFGTYAFFKTYQGLARNTDAVYVMPLWGMSAVKVNEFFKMANRDRRLSVAYEGKPIVDRGATVSSASASLISEARYNAHKAIGIRNGATPADLQVVFSGSRTMIINEQSAADNGVEITTSRRHEATVVTPREIAADNHFTLREVLHQVDQASPARWQSRELLAARKAAVGESRAAWWPQLQAGYRLEHFDDNHLYNERDRFRQTAHRATLRLDQLVFSRQTQQEIRLSRTEHKLTELEDSQHALALEAAATEAVADLLEAEQLWALAGQDRNRIDVYYEQCEAAWLIDSNGLAELYAWETEHARSTNRLSQAETEVAQARVHLNSILNYPSSMTISLDTAQFGEESFWNSYQRLETIIEQPTRRRQAAMALSERIMGLNPEVKQARREVERVERLAAVDRALFWPRVGLFAKFNLSSELADQPPDFYEEHRTWSIGAQVRLPLFLGGRRWQQKDRLRAEISSAEYRRDAVVLAVIERAQTDFEELLSRAEVCLRAIRASMRAGEALRWTSEAYDGAPSRFVATNDARQRYLEVQAEAIRARFDYWQTMARLLAQLGVSQLDSYRSMTDLLLEEVGAEGD